MTEQAFVDKSRILKKDIWTYSIAFMAIMFVLTGFLVGWAGFYSLAVLQPVFFVSLFLLVLKKRGLGKQEVLFLAMIFIFGYCIRTQNIQPRFKYFFGYDSYYHGRIIEYLLSDGEIPRVDPLAYFELPESDRLVPRDVLLFWYICAGLFKFFTMFGSYNPDLWVEVLKVLPAFFGALISVLMYFLGKELWGKNAGYMTAFVAAVIPSYVYRTMAGFLEDDALGFFWLVAGLIFFVRALKKPELTKKQLINALLAGIFFAGMALSWGFFLIIPILLILFFPIGLTLLLCQKDSMKKAKGFTVLYVISSGVFALLASLFKGTQWFNTMVDYVMKAVPFTEFSGGGIVALLVVIAFIVLIFGFFIFLLVFGTKDPERRKTTVRFLAVIFLFAVTAFTFIILSDPNGMFSSRIQTTEVFLSTVGEEGPGYPHFGYKYGILIVFPYLALLALPLFVFFKKKDYLTPLVFLWIAVSLVMAWYKLKFTYHFGLPIAIAAGAIAGIVFYFFKDFKAVESKVAVLALAFMMMCGLAIGAYFVTQREPSLETDSLWKQTLYWMRDNTPEGAKYMNWWSYGHWITFVARKSVFADNRNVRWDISDGHYAKFLMAQDLNESLELVRKYKPEYILVDSGSFQGFYSMAIYNFRMHASELDKNSYIRNLLIFAQPPRAGAAPYANFHYPCRYLEDQNAYHCVVYVIPKESFALVSDTWSAIPNEREQGIPVWSYREKDNSGFGRFLSTVNNSTLAKLWFHDPETMKYFEEIYKASDSIKTIKIFRVKKEAFGWAD